MARYYRCRCAVGRRPPRLVQRLVRRGCMRGSTTIFRGSELAALVAAALLPTAGDVIAQQPTEQFFARKTITVTIGYTAGGSYDLYGRMVARHLGKHVP